MLLHRISPQRLAVYLEATDHDLSRAIALYAWNSRVSAALFEIIGHLEVVLRNAIDSRMAIWSVSNGFDDNWLLNDHGLLTPNSAESIRRSIEVLRTRGIAPTRDRLVSEASFGFWRYLLTARYRTTLWPWVLRQAFPNLPSNEVDLLFHRVRRLNHIRNRVAHHEPLVHRRIDLAAQDAYLVIGSICSGTESWVRQQSRVERLLRIRP